MKVYKFLYIAIISISFVLIATSNVMAISAVCSPSDRVCIDTVSLGTTVSGYTCNAGNPNYYIDEGMFVGYYFCTAPVSLPPVITYVEPDPLSPINDIEFPEIFAESSSSFDGIKEKDAIEYDGLYFSNTTDGKIAFLDTVDLNDEDLLEKLKELDSYLKFGAGYVYLDSESIAQLNLPATVELYELYLLEGFEIVRDGVSSEEVSEVSYNSESNTLSFNVTGFSTYEVKPDLRLDGSYESEVTELKYFIDGYISAVNADVSILINDELIETVQSDENGVFSFEVELVQGGNEIVVSSIYGRDNATSVSEKLNVNYSLPVIEEEVNYTVYYIIGGVTIVFLIGVFAYFKFFKKSLSKKTDSKDK